MSNPCPIADLENYVREVWAYHCERRGSEFPLCSSAEFNLAAAWCDSDIPLRVVLRGMADTPKAGSSLFYYRPSVLEAFAKWKRAMVGLSTEPLT